LTIFLKVGIIAGLVASILIIFPTGDLHGKFVAHNQPAAIAGMEGLFHSEAGAGLVLMGQPNEETGQIDNPIVVNDALSFLIYGITKAEVKGLDQIPHDQWPTALPLLFYAYHIMAGLGTWFALLMIVSAFFSGASGSTRRAGLYGRCCSAFPCPTVPTPPAG
jgi:cytochrome d ubiquinol oxidase subunit I